MNEVEYMNRGTKAYKSAHGQEIRQKMLIRTAARLMLIY
jgi:hypothetical protein